MVTASAPGEVFLFGEHAVVHGQPALAAAVNRRTEVKVGVRKDKWICVNSSGIGKVTADLCRTPDGWCLLKAGRKRLDYVEKALELTFNKLGTARGLDLQIKSSIPPGSGLASSSAVSVATVAAVSEALGQRLSPRDIVELAFRTELTVQGAASRTGVAVATHGGFVKVRRGNIKQLSPMPRLQIIIGFTGSPGNTGILVRKVRDLYEAHPAAVGPIIESMGVITEAGIEAINTGDFLRTGALMNINQALLAALGVSSKKLEKLISAARSAGALGAKLSGAGGGGSMIALAPEKSKAVIGAIRRAGGIPIQVKVGEKGLVVKK